LRRDRTATARFGASRCIFLAEKQRKQRDRPRRRRLALALTKARGVKLGRTPKLTAHQKREAL
jgi:hypothetical protein